MGNDSGSSGDRDKELAQEQEYFDNALHQREVQRQQLHDAPAAAITAGAASNIREFVEHRLNKLQPPEAAVAFGRFDTDDGESWYIGHDSILDDAQEVLVINWRADAARPYFEASPENPMNLSLRRYFDTSGNQILSFEDLRLKEVNADVTRLLSEPTFTDTLLLDLERSRTGEMQDIVKTIQASQSSLMRSNLERLLIIQGGPGTGKTAVALHRVSWLLYHHRDLLSPAEVLVVGPNRTFVRYIRSVLPTLGDEDVTHSDLVSLLAVPVDVQGKDSTTLTRIKGERRMALLLERGLRDKIALPKEPVAIRTSSGTMTFDDNEIKEIIEAGNRTHYAAGRQRLRTHMRDRMLHSAGPDSVRMDLLDKTLDRIWPPVTAASFLQELFGSEGRLLRAAGEDFSAAEVQILYRRAAERLSEQTWSPSDVPLLDYADFLIRGEPPRTFRHVVLDEAQDMSHMELSMLARRCPSGSMTVVGDIAQSTGAWARNDWEDVKDILKGRAPVQYEELDLGYRVPRQIYELAKKTLPAAAPFVSPPRVVRDGPSDPELLKVEAEELAAVVLEKARSYAADGNSVGVITPDACRDGIEDLLQSLDVRWTNASEGQLGSGINLLGPVESKGLEFDAIIVVEPELIVADDPQGHRLLYVALTRTTRHLSVIYSLNSAPLEIGDEDSDQIQPISPASTLGTTESGNVLVASVSAAVGRQLGDLVNPDLIGEVIGALEIELGLSPATGTSDNALVLGVAREMAGQIKSLVNADFHGAVIATLRTTPPERFP